MTALAFALLARFLWGWNFILFFISREEVSERFLTIAYRFTVGLCFTAAFFAYQNEANFWSSPAFYFLLIFLLGMPLYSFVQSTLARIISVLLVFFSSFVLLPELSWVSQFNFISSSIFLGSIFMGQFLGHWFLNVPNIHIRELKRVVLFMFVGVALKTVEVLYTLFVVVGLRPDWQRIDQMGRPLGVSLDNIENLETLSMSNSLFAVEGDSFFGLGSFGIILLIARVLWGLVAPVILIWMVKRTVDQRATQSATGILYAMSVMLIVGEACGLYFLYTLGWFV